MAPPTLPDNNNNKIWHQILGDTTKPSLPLLHGLFSSHLKFLPLVPFLQDYYHIILVDLPCHSRSRSLQLNLPETVSALAQLIRDVSPRGKAHVAGMSYGALAALELARIHSDVVESLFASGAPPYEGKERFFASRPWLLWFAIAPTFYFPDFLFNAMARSFGVSVLPELRKEGQENYSFELMRRGFSDILDVTLSQVGQIHGVRVAAVAGGKQDNVDVTTRMGKVLREKDPESGCKAFVVRKAIHDWDMQFPDLFVEVIRCWIKKDAMLGLFEELV